MSKRNVLALLVNSLTKGEKRYFKMYTALQESTRDYLCLFELFEKGLDTDAAKEAFQKARPEASFEATGKYLYKVITDTLLHIRLDQHPSSKLIVSIMKANILFEKSLYQQGFKQLKKVQLQAEAQEQSLIQLWAAKLELNYLSNLHFNSISETELIQKQLKRQELLKKERHIIKHTELYELLRHRLLYKGSVRTDKQKQELNDLVVSELNIISTPFAETFESYKTHLLFQANYFITVNDYKSALKTFYELNELFEENEELWINSPMDYLSSVEGILDTLNTIRQYDEMEFFLKKLHRFLDVSGYMNLMVQRLFFIYKAAALIYKGQSAKAMALKENFDELLFKKMQALDLTKQAEVYLYAALIYMVNDNMNQAHHYLNRILMESKLYNPLPVYRTFRLIHLLVHYELGNLDYIEYETRSIKRGFNSSTRKSYLLEKIVFSFVQGPLPPGQKQRTLMWEKYNKKFDAIKSDKYEMQVLKIFDFAAWIKPRILKIPFSAAMNDEVSKLV